MVVFLMPLDLELPDADIARILVVLEELAPSRWPFFERDAYTIDVWYLFCDDITIATISLAIFQTFILESIGIEAWTHYGITASVRC